MFGRGLGVSSRLVQAVRGRKGSSRGRAGPNLRSLSRLQVRLVGRVPAVAFDPRRWALLPALPSFGGAIVMMDAPRSPSPAPFARGALAQRLFHLHPPRPVLNARSLDALLAPP